MRHALWLGILLSAQLSLPAQATPNQELKATLSQLQAQMNPADFKTVPWAKITSALQQGADPDSTLADGSPILHLAAYAAKPELVRLLLSKGADLHRRNPRGESVIVLAAAGGNREIVELLFAKGITLAEAQPMALTVAASFGRLEIVELLLAKGFPVDMIIDENDSTALMFAAGQSNPEIVKRLVKYGANLQAQDKKGNTLLHFAQHSASVAVVSYFLQTGKYDINARNSEGWTPLMMAAISDQPELIRLLLKQGAKPHFLNHDGENALLINLSLAWGPSASAHLLIEAGSDIQRQDGLGMPPLAWAVNNRDIDTVRQLLKLGADVNIRTAKNETLLQLAQRINEPAILTLLRQAGAKD